MLKNSYLILALKRAKKAPNDHGQGPVLRVLKDQKVKVNRHTEKTAIYALWNVRVFIYLLSRKSRYRVQSMRLGRGNYQRKKGLE